jgi:hypothetical protein
MRTSWAIPRVLQRGPALELDTVVDVDDIGIGMHGEGGAKV